MEISTARRNRKKENKTIIYLKENSIFLCNQFSIKEII